MTETTVISVRNVFERDKFIKQIYTNLTKEPSLEFIVVQDRVNMVSIYHNIPNCTRVLIKSYLIIILPVLIDLRPLDSVYGSVTFHLDETIKVLYETINLLKSKQGKKIITENSNVETASELDRLLR